MEVKSVGNVRCPETERDIKIHTPASWPKTVRAFVEESLTKKILEGCPETQSRVIKNPAGRRRNPVNVSIITDRKKVIDAFLKGSKELHEALESYEPSRSVKKVETILQKAIQQGNLERRGYEVKKKTKTIGNAKYFSFAIQSHDSSFFWLTQEATKAEKSDEDHLKELSDILRYWSMQRKLSGNLPYQVNEKIGEIERYYRTTKREEIKYFMDFLPPAPDLTDYHIIAVNTSAGKDSQAMMDYVVELAKEVGVMDRLISVHADLGELEWEGTKELALDHTKHYNMPFYTVQRDRDLLHQIEHEREDFPGQSARFCTSEHKTSQVQKLYTRFSDKKLADYLTDLLDLEVEKWIKDWREAGKNAKADKAALWFEGKDRITALRMEQVDFSEGELSVKDTERLRELRAEVDKEALRFFNKSDWSKIRKSAKDKLPRMRVLSCLGIRALEGHERARKNPFETIEDIGIRQTERWFPIFRWTEADVWNRIDNMETRYATPYDLGMSRLSCAFCVFATLDDLLISAEHNPELLDKYVGLEERLAEKHKKMTLKKQVSAGEKAYKKAKAKGLSEKEAEESRVSAMKNVPMPQFKTDLSIKEVKEKFKEGERGRKWSRGKRRLQVVASEPPPIPESLQKFPEKVVHEEQAEVDLSCAPDKNGENLRVGDKVTTLIAGVKDTKKKPLEFYEFEIKRIFPGKTGPQVKLFCLDAPSKNMTLASNSVSKIKVLEETISSGEVDSVGKSDWSIKKDGKSYTLSRPEGVVAPDIRFKKAALFLSEQLQSLEMDWSDFPSNPRRKKEKALALIHRVRRVRDISDIDTILSDIESEKPSSEAETLKFKVSPSLVEYIDHLVLDRYIDKDGERYDIDSEQEYQAAVFLRDRLYDGVLELPAYGDVLESVYQIILDSLNSDDEDGTAHIGRASRSFDSLSKKLLAAQRKYKDKKYFSKKKEKTFSMRSDNDAFVGGSVWKPSEVLDSVGFILADKQGVLTMIAKSSGGFLVGPKDFNDSQEVARWLSSKGFDLSTKHRDLGSAEHEDPEYVLRYLGNHDYDEAVALVDRQYKIHLDNVKADNRSDNHLLWEGMNVCEDQTNRDAVVVSFDEDTVEMKIDEGNGRSRKFVRPRSKTYIECMPVLKEIARQRVREWLIAPILVNAGKPGLTGLYMERFKDDYELGLGILNHLFDDMGAFSDDERKDFLFALFGLESPSDEDLEERFGSSDVGGMYDKLKVGRAPWSSEGSIQLEMTIGKSFFDDYFKKIADVIPDSIVYESEKGSNVWARYHVMFVFDRELWEDAKDSFKENRDLVEFAKIVTPVNPQQKVEDKETGTDFSKLVIKPVFEQGKKAPVIEPAKEAVVKEENAFHVGAVVFSRDDDEKTPYVILDGKPVSDGSDWDGAVLIFPLRKGPHGFIELAEFPKHFVKLDSGLVGPKSKFIFHGKSAKSGFNAFKKYISAFVKDTDYGSEARSFWKENKGRIDFSPKCQDHYFVDAVDRPDKGPLHTGDIVYSTDDKEPQAYVLLDGVPDEDGLYSLFPLSKPYDGWDGEILQEKGKFLKVLKQGHEVANPLFHGRGAKAVRISFEILVNNVIVTGEDLFVDDDYSYRFTRPARCYWRSKSFDPQAAGPLSAGRVSSESDPYGLKEPAPKPSIEDSYEDKARAYFSRFKPTEQVDESGFQRAIKSPSLGHAESILKNFLRDGVLYKTKDGWYGPKEYESQTKKDSYIGQEWEHVDKTSGKMGEPDSVIYKVKRKAGTKYYIGHDKSGFDKIVDKSDIEEWIESDKVWSKKYKSELEESRKPKESVVDPLEKRFGNLLNGKSAMQKARIIKALEKWVSWKDEIRQRYKHVEYYVKEKGWFVDTETIGGKKTRVLRGPDGSFFEQKDITKTAIDYAESIQAKKKPVTPQVMEGLDLSPKGVETANLEGFTLLGSSSDKALDIYIHDSPSHWFVRFVDPDVKAFVGSGFKLDRDWSKEDVLNWLRSSKNIEVITFDKPKEKRAKKHRKISDAQWRGLGYFGLAGSDGVRADIGNSNDQLVKGGWVRMNTINKLVEFKLIKDKKFSERSATAQSWGWVITAKGKRALALEGEFQGHKQPVDMPTPKSGKVFGIGVSRSGKKARALLASLDLEKKVLEDRDFYVKLKLDPFQDLSIERQGNKVLFTHWTMVGRAPMQDLAIDTEVEFDLKKKEDGYYFDFYLYRYLGVHGEGTSKGREGQKLATYMLKNAIGYGFGDLSSVQVLDSKGNHIAGKEPERIVAAPEYPEEIIRDHLIKRGAAHRGLYSVRILNEADRFPEAPYTVEFNAKGEPRRYLKWRYDDIDDVRLEAELLLTESDYSDGRVSESEPTEADETVKDIKRDFTWEGSDPFRLGSVVTIGNGRKRYGITRFTPDGKDAYVQILTVSKAGRTKTMASLKELNLKREALEPQNEELARDFVNRIVRDEQYINAISLEKENAFLDKWLEKVDGRYNVNINMTNYVGLNLKNAIEWKKKQNSETLALVGSPEKPGLSFPLPGQKKTPVEDSQPEWLQIVDLVKEVSGGSLHTVKDLKDISEGDSFSMSSDDGRFRLDLTPGVFQGPALPPGFDDFEESADVKSRDVGVNFESLGLENGSIVEVGGKGWRVRRVLSEVSMDVYKAGTKGKKLYRVRPIRSGSSEVEVHEIGAYGQKLHEEAEAVGPLEIPSDSGVSGYDALGMLLNASREAVGNSEELRRYWAPDLSTSAHRDSETGHTFKLKSRLPDVSSIMVRKVKGVSGSYMWNLTVLVEDGGIKEDWFDTYEEVESKVKSIVSRDFKDILKRRHAMDQLSRDPNKSAIGPMKKKDDADLWASVLALDVGEVSAQLWGAHDNPYIDEDGWYLVTGDGGLKRLVITTKQKLEHYKMLLVEHIIVSSTPMKDESTGKDHSLRFHRTSGATGYVEYTTTDYDYRIEVNEDPRQHPGRRNPSMDYDKRQADRLRHIDPEDPSLGMRSLSLEARGGGVEAPMVRVGGIKAYDYSEGYIVKPVLQMAKEAEWFVDPDDFASGDYGIKAPPVALVSFHNGPDYLVSTSREAVVKFRDFFLARLEERESQYSVVEIGTDYLTTLYNSELDYEITIANAKDNPDAKRKAAFRELGSELLGVSWDLESMEDIFHGLNRIANPTTSSPLGHFFLPDSKHIAIDMKRGKDFNKDFVDFLDNELLSGGEVFDRDDLVAAPASELIWDRKSKAAYPKKENPKKKRGDFDKGKVKNPISPWRGGTVFRSVSPWELYDIFDKGEMTGRASRYWADPRPECLLFYGDEIEGVLSHGSDYTRAVGGRDVFTKSYILAARVDKEAKKLSEKAAVAELLVNVLYDHGKEEASEELEEGLEESFREPLERLRKIPGEIRREISRVVGSGAKRLESLSREFDSYVVELGLIEGTYYTGKHSMAGGTGDNNNEICTRPGFAVPIEEIEKIHFVKAGRVVKTLEGPFTHQHFGDLFEYPPEIEEADSFESLYKGYLSESREKINELHSAEAYWLSDVDNRLVEEAKDQREVLKKLHQRRRLN